MTFIVNIKSTTPVITDRDIRIGYKPRYFASRANQISEQVHEISLREYNKLISNNFVVVGHLTWMIRGKLEDGMIEVYTGNDNYEKGIEPLTIPGVLTQNAASVMFLSEKIPAIKSYLRKYDQFYVGE